LDSGTRWNTRVKLDGPLCSQTYGLRRSLIGCPSIADQKLASSSGSRQSITTDDKRSVCFYVVTCYLAGSKAGADRRRARGGLSRRFLRRRELASDRLVGKMSATCRRQLCRTARSPQRGGDEPQALSRPCPAFLQPRVRRQRHPHGDLRCFTLAPSVAEGWLPPEPPAERYVVGRRPYPRPNGPSGVWELLLLTGPPTLATTVRGTPELTFPLGLFTGPGQHEPSVPLVAQYVWVRGPAEMILGLLGLPIGVLVSGRTRRARPSKQTQQSGRGAFQHSNPQ
jgi:hypothetical protein